MTSIKLEIIIGSIRAFQRARALRVCATAHTKWMNSFARISSRFDSRFGLCNCVRFDASILLQYSPLMAFAVLWSSVREPFDSRTAETPVIVGFVLFFSLHQTIVRHNFPSTPSISAANIINIHIIAREQLKSKNWKPCRRGCQIDAFLTIARCASSRHTSDTYVLITSAVCRAHWFPHFLRHPQSVSSIYATVFDMLMFTIAAREFRCII